MRIPGWLPVDLEAAIFKNTSQNILGKSDQTKLPLIKLDLAIISCFHFAWKIPLDTFAMTMDEISMSNQCVTIQFISQVPYSQMAISFEIHERNLIILFCSCFRGSMDWLRRTGEWEMEFKICGGHDLLFSVYSLLHFIFVVS